MIYYNRGPKWQFLNMFLMRGSVFPASCFLAVPCAVITFLLKWYGILDEVEFLANATAWSGFSSLVGFLVVFRTSEGYARFWDGCRATHRMRAEWIDACSALMAFTRASKAEKEKITKFKHLMVRLVSILHAMSLGELEDRNDLESLAAFNLELIDPSGLDMESWKSLMKCTDKVTLVFTWIQSVVVDNIATGVLCIPPPILSRVFQEFSSGMVALHDAQRIAHVPFPFPYAQSCDALLALHWLITPLVTVQWVTTPWAAAIFGFLQVFILWSLNNIAVEIEHPFGTDANDLDTRRMQVEMNMSLLLILHPAAERTPELSADAQIETLVVQGRKASVRLLASNSYNDIMTSVELEMGRFWSELPGRTGAKTMMATESASDEEQPRDDDASTEQVAELPLGGETRSSWAKRYSGCSDAKSVGSAPFEEPPSEEWPPKPQPQSTRYAEKHRWTSPAAHHSPRSEEGTPRSTASRASERRPRPHRAPSARQVEAERPWRAPQKAPSPAAPSPAA